MKFKFPILAAFFVMTAHSSAEVIVDDDAFAKSLGGWKKANSYVDYALSGAQYRTYKPETSPTPDGGIFLSIRIDYLRGWLSSDDHAVLEITVNSKGAITSAQSTIAIQGQSIASDLIQGGNQAGKELLNPNGAVQIGSDLVADLTAKLLREKIVEAGRVSFPSALRHNYNRLFQAIRVEGVAIPAATAIPDEPIVPPPPSLPPPPPAPPVPVPATPVAPKTAPVEPEKPKEADSAVPIQMKPFGTPTVELPLQK